MSKAIFQIVALVIIISSLISLIQQPFIQAILIFVGLILSMIIFDYHDNK